ncbi:pyruvate dehydrogenase (acetyl-transferring) E1 component subunit alpha [Geopsychrobacter electrodiphilus]|uniref:pyruvate dehydrogenase (acetyl-transferring) E1 component subunit alpha n=1 Tax=Geopsychrobacter electrodiphilus TaxID=225196 RepID=UPI00037C5BDD|nr:pyruvate dehydrogenase (acetyl-transferring) E1 component subunit alpha [Geopsychrobacter electrodiphilus]
MPRETLANFSIERLEILDPRGEVDANLLPDLTDPQFLRLYELLLLTRLADERALNLQREGRLGTFPSSLGQEAAQVGSAFALAPQDWVFPSFRELGVFLCLESSLPNYYRYWMGDERGQLCPPELNLFPINIAVGTHLLHAAGVAMGARYRQEPLVAVPYLGDGGTSKGDFYEALNFAGVYRLPLVAICQNNQWAISVSRRGQTATETLAQKALACGIKGIQVDGNDVLAVYQATIEALKRARSGGGATFIECETYRMSDHTTADDARRYRDSAELESWREKDPLLRMRRFLEHRGLWIEADQQAQEQALLQRIDQAVEAAEAVSPPTVEEMFRYTCHQLSSRQEEQLKECRDGRA